MKNEKRKKGFTLVELLAVIVILAIILLVVVPNVLKQIENTRTRAFYTSVHNLVDNIEPETVLEAKDYCIYNYKNDKEGQTELIEKMYVIAHLSDDSSKIIYSVYATSNKGKIIDIEDFDNTKMEDEETWNDGGYLVTVSNLYNNYYEKLLDGEVNNSEIKKYSTCGVNK